MEGLVIVVGTIQDSGVVVSRDMQYRGWGCYLEKSVVSGNAVRSHFSTNVLLGHKAVWSDLLCLLSI